MSRRCLPILARLCLVVLTGVPAPAVAEGTGAPALARAPLTLEAAVGRALERNERARAAGARVEAADARLARARAFFWPDLTLTGNYTHRLFEPQAAGGRGFGQDQDVLSATAGLSATIFDFRTYPLLRQARQAREASRLNAAEERRALAFEAAQAFLATLGAEQVVEAALRRRALAAQGLREAKARAEARLASVHDVTRSELASHDADAAVARVRVAAAQARVHLAALLDLPETDAQAPLLAPAALLSLSGPAPDAVTTGAGGLVEAARAERADLAARRAGLAAQAESADEPGRRFVPSLRFDAQYGVSSQEGFGGRHDDGVVGLTLAWPLFDGFERDAEEDERRAVWREQAAMAEQAVRFVERDVRLALVALEAQSAQIEATRAAAGAATRNTQETTTLYGQGLASAFEVADALTRQFEAEVALTQAELGLAAARLQLSLATGAYPPGAKERD